jgi:hypothetical protein
MMVSIEEQMFNDESDDKVVEKDEENMPPQTYKCKLERSEKIQIQG